MQPVDVEGLGLNDYYEVWFIYACIFSNVTFALIMMMTFNKAFD
jgi:hypothetical protein